MPECFIGLLNIRDLGREKFTGKINLIADDEKKFNLLMRNQFSKHLLSSDISFSDGKIFAGFRKVGEFDFIIKEVSCGCKEIGDALKLLGCNIRDGEISCRI